MDEVVTTETRKVKHASKFQTLERTIAVEELIVNGVSYNEIIAYCDTAYDLRRGMAKRLISFAYKRLEKRTDMVTSHQRAIANRRFHKLYRMAINPPKRLTTIVLKERNEEGKIVKEVPTQIETKDAPDIMAGISAEGPRAQLLGLDAPKQVEVFGKDGGPILVSQMTAEQRHSAIQAIERRALTIGVQLGRGTLDASFVDIPVPDYGESEPPVPILRSTDTPQHARTD